MSTVCWPVAKINGIHDLTLHERSETKIYMIYDVSTRCFLMEQTMQCIVDEIRI